jgi:hypothetical protein
MRRNAAHSGDFSPAAGPSSDAAAVAAAGANGGGEGSASKSGRRNNSAGTTTAAAAGLLVPQSLPALAARTLLGFALGSLGVLAFLWLSSLATTADGVPSTLLLARQRYDREVR